MSQVGWFPRFNPDGSRLTWERDGYWQAQWLNPTTEIAQDGKHLVIGDVVTEFLTANELSAGGDVWAAYRTDPVRVFTSTGLTLLGAACPVVNPAGKLGYVDDGQADVKSLVFDGRSVSRGAVTDVRASRQALVWSASGRTWGIRLDQLNQAHEIQAAPTEFRPIPIDTPTGPWVLSLTHTGFVLRPFGELNGYRFDNGGQTFYPDAVWRNGLIVTIFTNANGEQSERVYDPQFSRVPLGVVAPVPAPAPAPIPVPVPSTPKEPVPMLGITDAQFSTLQRVRVQYGATVSPSEIGAILNEFTWIHKDEGLGLQAKDGGTVAIQPVSNRTVWNGIRIGNFGQDVLIGASVGLATPARGEVGPADPHTFVAPVRPVGAAVPGQAPTTPGDPSTAAGGGAALDAEIAKLKRQIAILTAQYGELKDLIANIEPTTNGTVSIDGVRVALRAENGKFVSAELDQPNVPMTANRESAFGWETFTLVRR